MNLVNLPRATWKRQPDRPVQLNRDSGLASGLRHLIVPFGLYPRTTGGLTDFFGNIAPDFGNGLIEGLRPSVIGNDAFLFPYGTFIGTQTAEPNFQSPITSSDDITIFSRLYVASTSFDHGLVSFNDGAWSWLDQAGGVLRISAFTSYDTTNVIDAPGVWDVGLIWRANATFQTVLGGRFSQAGSRARPSFTGICGPHRGSAGWSSSLNGVGALYGAAFWGVWARALSEGETRALSENPWQIFVAQTSRSYFIPTAPTLTIPTLSLPGVTDITATSARPQVTLTY